MCRYRSRFLRQISVNATLSVRCRQSQVQGKYYHVRALRVPGDPRPQGPLVGDAGRVGVGTQRGVGNGSHRYQPTGARQRLWRNPPKERPVLSGNRRSSSEHSHPNHHQQRDDGCGDRGAVNGAATTGRRDDRENADESHKLERSSAIPVPVAAPVPAAVCFNLSFFDWYKATLTDRAIIRDAPANSTHVQNTGIEMSGYTVTSGTSRYSQTHSERRAHAAAREVVREGMPAGPISTPNLAQTDPLLPTGPVAVQPQNRRLETVAL
jgi:outer membrane protein OmpA-like peptidoglycan-associated protein